MNSRDIFVNNLRAIMKERKVSRKELADALNIPYTTLCDWCTGRIFPRVEKINLLADYFKIKKADLIEDGIDDNVNSLIDDIVEVDILSKVPFGNLNNHNINKYIVGRELLPPEWIRNHNSFFGFLMNDNSMEPEIHIDDCLIIKEVVNVEQEGLYCVSENNEDATIRKIIMINDGIMVMPTNVNDKYQPKAYKKDDINNKIKILGTLVQLIRKY